MSRIARLVASAPARAAAGAALSAMAVALPGHPFQVVPSPDGCWLYVSLNSSGPRSLNGVAVMKRAGSVYLNCTRDDRTLFVSDEYAQAITVIDLERARANGYKADAIVGKIPVGRAPVALTFSPDERTLFTTSQAAPKSWGWPAECVPEGDDPMQTTPAEPRGAVIVVDVERARRDPSNAVVARVPAGCHPVRLVLSEAGDVAFVTARKSNALLAFDTAKLRGDSTAAGIGSVPVGSAPVGVTVARAGGREVVVVANSNRFASAGAESLTVIDARRIGEGAAATIGRIPAGRFPRELRAIDNGRTLVVTNFLSDSIQLVDLDRVPLAAR